MPETSKSEQREWNGFISSMFSSLFWLQENRLTPRNRCTKCNRPKVQTSPFDVRCKCSVLVSKDTTSINKQSSSCESKSDSNTSIALTKKSSPITSKISALCTEDSFIKLISKDSITKAPAEVVTPPMFLELVDIPVSKDRSITCNLDSNEKEVTTENVLFTTENDDKQNNVECHTQTDNFDEDEFSISDGKSSSTSSSQNDDRRDLVEVNLIPMRKTSQTSSSSDHEQEVSYNMIENIEHFSLAYSTSLLNVEERTTRDDLLPPHAVISSNHNFQYENCSSQANLMMTLSNINVIMPVVKSPTELDSSSGVKMMKKSRIPIYKTRLVDKSAKQNNIATESKIIKIVNYQQTLSNKNQNVPKKIQRGDPIESVKRGFNSMTPSKQKKTSQSFVATSNNITQKKNLKNSKTITTDDTTENRYSDIKYKLSDKYFTKKNQKLTEPRNVEYQNADNNNFGDTKSIHSKCYDIINNCELTESATTQKNFNDSLIKLASKSSECNNDSLLTSSATNNYIIDDGTIVTIESLIPKNYQTDQISLNSESPNSFSVKSFKSSRSSVESSKIPKKIL